MCFVCEPWATCIAHWMHDHGRAKEGSYKQHANFVTPVFFLLHLLKMKIHTFQPISSIGQRENSESRGMLQIILHWKWWQNTSYELHHTQHYTKKLCSPCFHGFHYKWFPTLPLNLSQKDRQSWSSLNRLAFVDTHNLGFVVSLHCDIWDLLLIRYNWHPGPIREWRTAHIVGPIHC